MTAYLVTIMPERDDAPETAQAIIRVETAPVARITEITIKSAVTEGLSTARLPTVDVEAVVGALIAGTRGSAPATLEPTSPVDGQRSDEQVEVKEVKADAPKQEAAAPPTGKVRKSDRPYRQMPPPEELQAVYDRVGTVTGVATHYDVPRHTAQGWMARLRKLAG